MIRSIDWMDARSIALPAEPSPARITRILRPGWSRVGSRTGRSRTDVLVTTRRTVLAAAGFPGRSALARPVIEPAEDQPAEAGVLRDGFETGRTDLAAGVYRHDGAPAGARAVGSGGAHAGGLSERFLFEAGPGSRFFVSEALPKIPVTEDLSAQPLRAVQPVRCPALRLGGPAGRHRPGHEGPFVLAGPRHGLQPARPVGEAGAGRHAAGDRGAGPGAPGLDPAAGVAPGGVPRARRRESDGGPGRDRRVPGRSPGRPRPAGGGRRLGRRAGRQPVADGDRAAGNGARKAGPGKARDEDESALPPIKFTRGVFEKLIGRAAVCPLVPHGDRSAGANPSGAAARRDSTSWSPTRSPIPRRSGPPWNGGCSSCRGCPARPRTAGSQRVLEAIAGYPLPGAVVLWSIGEHLGSQRADRRAHAGGRAGPRGRSRPIHESDDELHLATATVDGEFRLYARSPSNLDVIGVDLPIWGTSQSLIDGLDYLNQRRIAHRADQSGSLVLGAGCRRRSRRRGHPEHLGRRRGPVLGPAARPARAAPAHDLHGPGGRMSRDSPSSATPT